MDPFRFFGIDEATCSRVLSTALARGGDYADLFFEHRTSSSITLDEERIETAGRSVNLGLGVRVLEGDATGYAYTEDLTLEGMLRVARTASAVARSGGTPEGIHLRGMDALSLYAVETPLIDLGAAEKAELLRRADQAARASDSRIRRATVALNDSMRRILIVNSEGRWVTDTQPMVRMDVHVIAEQGDNRQQGSAGGGGRYGMDYFVAMPPEELGREAARSAIVMLDAREAPAGQLPVVLAPGDAGVLLHEAVGHGLEADFNRKRTSNYSDRIGERVASPLCTIVDDGTIAQSRGSINVDDEGNLPQRNVLIENGILKGYLHDQLSRSHYGIDPSGNGRRQDYRHVPMPRMTNTYLMPGPHEAEEIIRSVDRGIYAVRFGGGQVNISNGDFVFSITEGYLIENGKITAPLKGMNLIGNGPDAMEKVTMAGTDYELSDGRWTCGKDGQSVPVGVGMPTIKVSSMTVGGSSTH